jgi:hypothetical protein
VFRLIVRRPPSQPGQPLGHGRQVGGVDAGVQPPANLISERQRLPGADRPLDQITHDRDRVLVVGGGQGQQAAGVVEFDLRVRLGGEPAAAARGRRTPAASGGSSSR